VRGDDAAVARQARRCVEALADIGVRVAVEFLPTIELNSIDAVCRLLDQVDHPALTVMIDSWHFFEGPSTWHSLESLPVDRLGFVQFSDAARALTEDVAFEYRHRRVLPGEGTHDVAGFAQAIQRRSADVTVSIEVLSAPWRRRPVERFAADALAATRRVWESS
jgi:sugar phosphate isomerase/epimerase